MKKKTVKKTSLKSKKDKTKVLKKSTKTKKRIISGDKIYQVINKVQVKRKPCEFAVCFDELEVIRHIIDDIGLEYTCKQAKNGVDFILYPDPNPENDTLSEGSIEENIFSDLLGED